MSATVPDEQPITGALVVLLMLRVSSSLDISYKVLRRKSCWCCGLADNMKKGWRGLPVPQIIAVIVFLDFLGVSLLVPLLPNYFSALVSPQVSGPPPTPSLASEKALMESDHSPVWCSKCAL